MSDIRWVRQEDAHGCSIAAPAMVTGQTYAYVKQWFVERMPAGYDFAAQGITHYPQDDYLTEHGYATRRKSAGAYNVRRQSGWPPDPFGPIHLCSVSSPAGGHMVVMLADGTVFDPLTPEPKRLSDWGPDRVNYVHAVYPVDGPGGAVHTMRRP